MPSTHKTNPTHGQKVTTDPVSRRDLKLENSGPVAKDSLAADSIRSGGSFSAGNPTGISGATGSSGTFAVDPSESGNVRTIRGKGEDTLGSIKAGHPGREVREKVKETPLSGGGNQAQGSFNISHDEFESKDTTGHRLGVSKNFSGGEDEGGLSASKYSGGDTSSSAGGQGSRHTVAGSGGGSDIHTKRVVPNTARSEETLEEGLDWSKVSKDTVSTTDIGGPDDPGRIAENHMAKQAARKGQGLGNTGGRVSGGDGDNIFDALNDTEGAPGVEDPSRS